MRYEILLAFALVGCGDNNKPPTVGFAPPNPAVWQFQASPGMSTAPSYGSGGFQFTFPSTDGVHYLVKGYSGALSRINVNYTIAVTGTPIFDYRTGTQNTCGPGYPGTVTAYFQRLNDWISEFGRWFAFGVNKDLEAGTFIMNVPLTPSADWVSVFGKTSAAEPAQFAAAASAVSSVGVVFGGGCFAGHGVFVTGGTASMTASSFEAN